MKADLRISIKDYHRNKTGWRREPRARGGTGPGNFRFQISDLKLGLTGGGKEGGAGVLGSGWDRAGEFRISDLKRNRSWDFRFQISDFKAMRR